MTTPGAPGVFIGHNEHVAWGITNVLADVQDLFLEKFDEAKPGQYLTLDGWRAAKTRHEEIAVRKAAADPETQSVGVEVTTTRHGPIVQDKAGARYALAWPALDPSSQELQAYYYLDRARSSRELEEALRRYLTRDNARKAFDGAVHYRLGAILERRGDTEGARSEYQAAITLDPRNVAAKRAAERLRSR